MLSVSQEHRFSLQCKVAKLKADQIMNNIPI